MNYSACIKSLANEIKPLRQYKKLSPVARVLAVIGLLPFIIPAFLLFIGFHVSIFFYKGTGAVADSLESWLDERKQGLQHATEAVLFWVTMPTIFFLRFFLSLYATAFYFHWFFLQCLTYIATLGGILWCPYIQDTEKTKEGTSWTAVPTKFSNIFPIWSCLLLALLALFMLLFSATIAGALEINPILPLVFLLLFGAAYFLLVVFGVPFGFKKRFDDENICADEADDALPEL